MKVFFALFFGILCLCLGVFFLVKNADFGDEKMPMYTMQMQRNFKDISSGIFIYDGVLYFLSDGFLVKVDTDLNELERHEIPIEKISENFLIDGDIFYARSASKKIFAYDFKQKKLLWEFSAPKKILADLSFAGDFLVFGAYDFKLYALNKKTGALAFEYEAKEAINDKVLVDNSKLYFGDCAGVLTCVDMATKQVVSAQISEHLPTAPILFGKSLLLLDYQNTIFCLDKNSLEEEWQIESDAEKIYAFDDKTFAISSSLSILNNDTLETLISLDENLIAMEKFGQNYALISNYGTLYIVDIAEKKVLYEYKFGVDLYNIKSYLSKIFIMDTDNNIYLLKANEQ